MDPNIRQDLVNKTRKAAGEGDWFAVEATWRPWVDQGDTEAQFQLAYFYLFVGFSNEPAEIRPHMEDLLAQAAAKDHPDALYWLSHLAKENAPERERLLLKSGELGCVRAQRLLGALYATGEWTGPKDEAQAVVWYRKAAEQGEASAQYSLGFMTLLGEGTPKNVDEGLGWLHRAAEQQDQWAIGLLADLYEHGYEGVPKDPAKGLVWRSRLR